MNVSYHKSQPDEPEADIVNQFCSQCNAKKIYYFFLNCKYIENYLAYRACCIGKSKFHSMGSIRS